MTPIIYLHGFASSPASSKARYFASLLRGAGVEVEIPDLAQGDFEHLTLSRQLEAIARAARGRRVSLIGSSMGGYLAALYAARHVDVERLVLLAPAFSFELRWHAWLGPEGVAKWRECGLIEVFHYGLNRNCGLSYGILEDAANYEEFPDFHQPALMFHGRNDDVVPVELAKQFAAAHPNATLEVMASGHDLLDVLDLIGPRVLEFLR